MIKRLYTLVLYFNQHFILKSYKTIILLILIFKTTLIIKLIIINNNIINYINTLISNFI